MPTPLDVPNRVILPVRLAYTTTTGDAPRRVQDTSWGAACAGEAWFCPGSNGEISSSSCRSIFGDRCFCW